MSAVKNGEISITGLDKADVLAALYNASQPLGIEVSKPLADSDMTTEQAREIMMKRECDGRAGFYYDYVQGRVMKIDLSTDMLDTRLYNCDNGDGAAERVIEALRRTL